MIQHDDWFMLLALLAAFAANEVWRSLGVMLSARLREDSALFAWVRMVATALVAGLVAKLVLSPTGAFGQAPLWLRLAAVGCGLAAYAVGRRSMAFGVGVSAAALIAGMVWLGP